MDAQKFKIRSGTIFLLIGIWATIAAAHVFYYAVMEGGRLREESNRIAWREGSIPAVRGNILDKNSIPLAWTERHYDLYLLELPKRSRRQENLLLNLKERLNVELHIDFSEITEKILLKRDLSPEEILTFSKLEKSFPELGVDVRFERLVIDYPQIRKIIGECGVDSEGALFGISGLEKDVDEILAGVHGEFIVMLDKYGNWLDGTLKILKEPVSGENIFLQTAFSDYLGEGGNE